MRLGDFDIHTVGNTLQLVGAIYAERTPSGDDDQVYLVPFPDEVDVNSAIGDKRLDILDMDHEDWKLFLRQSDILETEVIQKAASGELTKAILRKSQRQIDQSVSWKVWKRDKYSCRYCGKDNVPLTVDHLVRWEEQGPSIEENLLSSCRKCNRTRGNMSYADWLKDTYYTDYVSDGLDEATKQANLDLLPTLDKIPRLVHKRSR